MNKHSVRKRVARSVLVAAACWLRATSSAAASPTIEQVQQMQSVAAQQALPGFIAAAVANGWQSPVIPSAWYVANVCPPEQRLLAQAARELGSALLSVIDGWAPLLGTEQGEVLFAKTQALVDLAYWLGATEGYANLILAYRARDVALTGLGRLAVDLSHPLAGPAALLRRIPAPFDAPSVRARVLNAEAGAALFPIATDTTDQALLDVWLKRASQRDIAEFGPLPTPGGQEDEMLEQLRQHRNQLIAMGYDPDQPDPHGAFFKDDRVADRPTTRNYWEKKLHQAIVNRSVPARAGRLEYLVTFREVIGTFPQRPQSRRDPFAPELEEAFFEAWEPHVAGSSFNLGTRASGAYQAIQAGMWLDDDSDLVRLAFEKTPGNPRLGAPTALATPTP